MHTLLGTGLRREELVNLDLDQVAPNTSEALRAAKKAKISGVRGKGGTSRTVFLGADGRTALADYLDQERPADAGATSVALFLSAVSIGSRRPDGRHISPLRPHDLRHSYAFALAAATGSNAYELERRLGHQSQRYIHRYTNPPEDIAAGYVENL